MRAITEPSWPPPGLPPLCQPGYGPYWRLTGIVHPGRSPVPGGPDCRTGRCSPGQRPPVCSASKRRTPPRRARPRGRSSAGGRCSRRRAEGQAGGSAASRRGRARYRGGPGRRRPRSRRRTRRRSPPRIPGGGRRSGPPTSPPRTPIARTDLDRSRHVSYPPWSSERDDKVAQPGDQRHGGVDQLADQRLQRLRVVPGPDDEADQQPNNTRTPMTPGDRALHRRPGIARSSRGLR